MLSFIQAICTFNFIYVSTSAKWLNLSPDHYANCAYHVLNLYPQTALHPYDAIEDLLVSNQGDQHWTITQHAVVTVNNSTVNPARIRKTWEETCSVNIMLVLEHEACFVRYLISVFHTLRVYNVENKFVLVLHPRSACRTQDIAKLLITSDVYIVYIDRHFEKTGYSKSIYLYGQSCIFFLSHLLPGISTHVLLDSVTITLRNESNFCCIYHKIC